MDVFIIFLATVSAFLCGYGAIVLGNRSLEIGRLLGIYWLMWGTGIGALAAVLWAIQHLSIKVV